MEFDYETQHRPRLEYVAADGLSRLYTEQPDKSNLDDDISKYNANEVHAINDIADFMNVEPLTVKSFVSVLEKDTYCHQLAEADSRRLSLSLQRPL